MRITINRSLTMAACTLLALSVTAIQAEEKVSESDIIATVNGEPISIADRTIVSKQLLARGQGTDDARITQELVNLELLRQEAIKRKLDSDPEVLAQIELLKTRILANAAMAAIGKEIKISDEEIQKEYKKQVDGLNLQEFKASHILLKDEQSAKAVIAEVSGGADFAEVAKAKSTGPSGPNGGDLGWFNEKSMVPEFSAAVMKMNAGDISTEPVKTQFGYHVIKLMETRESPSPKLEDVKGEIQTILTQAGLSAEIEKLRKSAKIEIK